MNQISIGNAIPDFEVLSTGNKTIKLTDYRGRYVVMYFYPKDNTPICTQEACRFRDDIGVLGDLGASVLGVSLDDSRSHAEFARQYHIPFPLLSDVDGRTAADYDSLLNFGLVKFAQRHTFIIGPDGRIAARFDKVDPAHHAQEVAHTLRNLQRASQ